jgi:hypothetical protein
MDTAPKLMVALQAGKEMGLQPLEAINSFYFVNGKVALYGDMAIAQVLRAGHKVEWIDCNDKTATVKITRGDNGASNQITFTMQMAIERNLTKNPVYKTYPENMLRFKAFHLCAKFIVSDALHGNRIAEIEEAEYVVEVPEKKIATKQLVENAKVVVPVEKISLEEAINKEPEQEKEPEQKKVIEEMPVEEPKIKPKTIAQQKMDNLIASRKAARTTPATPIEITTGLPGEVCQFINAIEGINEIDLPNDILDLKVDANKGIFKGVDAYPSLREEAAKFNIKL